MNLISDYEAHKRDEEWNAKEDRRLEIRAMLKKQEVMGKYYAMAKRYFKERDLYDIAKPEEFDHMAEKFRYDDFRKAIEPYEHYRNKAVGDWLALQAIPHYREMPQELKKIVALWDEQIDSVARDFGYDPTQWRTP